MTFRRLFSSIADLLWAPRCASCDAPVQCDDGDAEQAAFCDLCLAALDRSWPPRCPRCGVSFDAGGFDHVCGRCLAQPPPFESLVAPYAYGGALSSAISRFKYGQAPWLAAPLSRLLFDAYVPRERVDVIVPVPLHPRRLRERGYNQAALLAGRGPRALGLPLATAILHRVIDTPHQAGLSGQQRLDALAGAFRARPCRRLEGARVLLVDDVATTTATVRAASAALVDAGASAVHVLCLARTM